jgi:hypothetical protein
MSDESPTIGNISQALTQFEYPTITMWNRLEGRPRTKNFDRALKAEIRDALWMLTKQWQMGEFRGDDAGSPVSARIQVENTRFTKYRARNNLVRAFPEESPLEAVVEHRKIPFVSGTHKIALDLRLQMGRQWLKMLEKMGFGSVFQDHYIKRYPISTPDPTKNEDAYICAHSEIFSRISAFSGRAMDGGAFYTYITASSSHHAYDGIPGLTVTMQGEIEKAAERFILWVRSLYLQPDEEYGDAWDPSHLEYQFTCSAPGKSGEKVYNADEYAKGHLDWFNLDEDPRQNELETSPGFVQPQLPPAKAQAFIPTTISFQGMPNTRWWTLEDSRTNFGDIKPDTVDLGKLLLIEFGLIYANDWFLFPLTLPAGSISLVKGLTVTNVFGERIWIEPAGSGPDDEWQRWRMFNTSIKGDMNEQADLSLLLLPTVSKVQDGAPLEEIVFIRDEIANMVWGIETTIPMADGNSKRGTEAGFEYFGYLQGLINQANSTAPPDSSPREYKAGIRYQVMNSVPENWIPFVPVHVEGSNREIQLQRGAMPRILKGGPDSPDKVRPRTTLLNEGRENKTKKPYFIFEEEIPRAGCQVSLSFRRTRWYDGRVVTWLGIRKNTGRGEGSSGLAFDQIIPTDANTG